MQRYEHGTVDTMVDIHTVAALTGVPERTAQWRASRDPCAVNTVRGQGGRSGYSYQIPLKSLPAEAQIRYHLMQEGIPKADLASYLERFGPEKLKQLLDKLYAVKELQLLRGDKRSAARRAELAKQFGVKPRCLYDWEKKYEAEGLEGLMDKTMRSDKGKSRSLCLLAQDRINYLYMASGKLSQNRVHQNLLEMRDRLGPSVCDECCHNPESCNRAEMLSRGLDPGEECHVCGSGLVVAESRCAVNRYVSQLDPALVTLGRYGSKPFDDLYMPKARRDKPERINAVWFGDHHVFDVFVDVGDGKAARPWLTAWMDACSGCIVGWAISLNPNSDTIVESLALGIARTKGSPFWGMPEYLYIDNGKDYRCKRIEGDGDATYQPGSINVSLDGDNALLRALGIGVTHAIPYRARSKTIERIFGLIEGQWIRGLPGYCGNGIDLKPETLMADIRQNKLMTLEEFVAYWVNTVLPGYHAYKASADKQSPMEIYESHEKARTEMPSWAMLAVAKSQRAERVVRPDGIYLNRRRYWDDALAEIVGRRVVVLHNQGEAASVSVLMDGQWVCEAAAAVNMKLIGEDEERIAEHLAMQARTRKSKMAALKLPRDRVKMLDTMAMEIPDMASPATITSLVHERAYRGKQELQHRQEAKADTKRKVGKALRTKYEAAGLALLQMPDAE